MRRYFLSLFAGMVWMSGIAVESADEQLQSDGYQKPPQAITDILDVPPTPSISLSPNREYLLLIERAGYPPITDLAAPMLRLAGLRINPDTSGPHMAPRTTGFVIQTIATGQQRRVDVSGEANLGFQGWSPDGRRFAFTSTTSTAMELWIASTDTAAAWKLEGVVLSGAYGNPVQWMPDSRSLLVQLIPADRGTPPIKPRAPRGPIVEESSGKAGPVRTYQDLLQNSHDEDLFDYYCSSQLAIVSADSGVANEAGVKPVGLKRLFSSIDVSPDGQHLLVTTLRRPYSYVLPLNRFPKTVEVWDLSGKVEHTLAELPLEDRIPIDGVPTGPRQFGWRPTQPATLLWLEALDDGDPRKQTDFRDRVLQQAFPFSVPPFELTKTGQRCLGASWGETNGLVFIRDYDRDRRWIRTYKMFADEVSSDVAAPKLTLVWERSVNDRYGDPGTPLSRPLPNGRRVMWQHGDFLFLESSGATPRGDRPFLDRFHLTTGETTRLFQCGETSLESVIALVKDDGSEFIVQHESPVDPPNFFLQSADGSRKRLTNFPDPMPQLRNIHKELVTYKRADGVDLSFTLYLPPDVAKGTPLPTVVWAYPREFNDPSTAGQVSGSTNRFTTIGGISHLFLLTQGYAILDEATMPVVGAPEVANDTFVEQIVASAKAAIDKAVELGVTDPRHVGVGGHSYGAFMTANLLAHSDLFRAGVARSGAYNRTLTPFGFQNERRTFWEAPHIYMSMSPFASAHQISKPILLIHGEADNNPGTFPIQSERLYQAIRGNGGTVRYVTLPHESHGYAARESIDHTLWEMVTWFNRYLRDE